MSVFQSGQRQIHVTRSRPSTLVTPDLSTIPSSTLVTSSTTSSFISLPSSRHGSLANASDVNARGFQPSSTNSDGSDAAANDLLPALRSASSMQGLLLAEMGGSMVELDVYAQQGGSGYRIGQRIDAGFLTPGGSTLPLRVEEAFAIGKEVWREEDRGNQKGTWRRKRGTITLGKGKDKDNSAATPHGIGLTSSDTLLQISAAPQKSTSELRTLLGNSAFRLKRNASVIPPAAFISTDNFSPAGGDDSFPTALALEKAKSRARVEVDIVLESETCVQGNSLKGHITIHVRNNAHKKYNTPIFISKAKVRVVGYEAIPYGNTRCTFYQCTALLSDVAPAWRTVLSSLPDEQGWAEAKEGIHVLPFSLTLPADGSCGTAKGTLDVHSGVALKYFAMASLKLKDPDTSVESVAHFYRSCEIWPRLSFTEKLSPAPRPLVSEAAKSVFMGGNGKVKLSAAMHRLYWVAGQRCVIHLRVVNESKKTVKGASITLFRTTTVFKPLGGRKGDKDPDPDACETVTMRKIVAASVLVMGQKCAKGHASAKGWWTGVRPGDTADFVHYVVLPSDALSVARVRLVEVEYTLNVSITTGALASDVEVTLPIRIINFLSVDPPPTAAISLLHGRLLVKPQLVGRTDTWYRKSRPNHDVEETVPGMKYSGTDMTVVAQEEIGTSMTQISIASGKEASGDSMSVYPPSESAVTITQQDLNASASLNDIDRVIGADSRTRNFVAERGQLMISGSLGSQLGPRGPRDPRPSSLPRPIAPALGPQGESTPRKHVRGSTSDHMSEKVKNGEPVRPFIGRQPSITRASSMLVSKTTMSEQIPGEMKNRSKSEMLSVR